MMKNFGREMVTIGDAGCVAVLIDQSGLTSEKLPVYVETGGRYARGQTIVDLRPKDMLDRFGELKDDLHVEVSLDIDADYYRQLFREAVGC